MATTEDYLNAIKAGRTNKKKVSMDFSALPEGVDAEQIRAEMSLGLPAEYGAALKGAKKSVKLDFASIPFAEPVDTAMQARRQRVAAEGEAAIKAEEVAQ